MAAGLASFYRSGSFVPKAVHLRTETQAVLDHWCDSRKASLFWWSF
ncbi:hypothetical protein HMPREF9341_00443 [Cutibacterium acnes HL103PA1]|nr:hypothetical protein HMPREF9341_00443 [Cutibacterium acnes HL103PA1]